MKVSNVQQIFGIDLRTLAFFRVVLACLLLGDLADRAIDLGAHYTDAGVLPRVLLLSMGGWRPSLHVVSGSIYVQAALFLLAALCAGALLVGYRTRIATALCWFLTMSLQTRNPLVMQGGDTLMLLLLFWSIFLPLGARFSFDAALASKVSENSYFSIATFALLFQCMYVYFFGALMKSGELWLPDGTAVAYALQVNSYATEFGQWLRGFPSVTRALTYFTWYLELLAPFFMFAPIFHLQFRVSALVLLIALHLGFVLFLKVGIFPLVSLTSLLVFIPGVFWDRLDSRRASERPLKIYYDQPCDFCRKTCLLLRTFLILRHATIEPAQPHPAVGPVLERENSWVVIDADGVQYLRWDAMILLVRHSPLFAPFARLMQWRILHGLGERFYGWVARNRMLLGGISSRFLSYDGAPRRLPMPIAIVVGLLFMCVLYANTVQSPAFPYHWPKFTQPVIQALSLQQSWDMFAPNPMESDMWYMATGELLNGERVDLLRGYPSPQYEIPDDLSDFFSRHRWRWYYQRVLNHVPDMGPRMFARYLCDRWDRLHQGREVFRINLGYATHALNAEGAVGPLQHVLLVDEECAVLRRQPQLVASQD